MAVNPAPDLSGLFTDLDRNFLPHLSVDCVIFGSHAGELKVLLLNWKQLDAWMLPGGFVRRVEPIDHAAARVLRERAGLEGVFLQQFHTFGATDRGESGLIPALRALGTEPPPNHWMVGRVVSVGYFALVDFTRAQVVPDALSAGYAWWNPTELPRMLLDHDRIVERGLATVRAQIDYLPLAESLLPREFTMPELQRLHEAVLGQPLDRRNFQKRMLELGVVKRLPARRTGGSHRPPFLYRWRGLRPPD
jgi:ADP-ribose pyrophosphatase YjhB (NUDIX family)